MRLLFDTFGCRLRIAGCVWLLLAAPLALAGSIGFLVKFTADEMSLSNTGTAAAYQISLWTLDPSAKWQTVEILSGNAAYIAPGESLKGRRQSAPATTGLGRSDPLLVLLHDQAGSRITQLAWRQAPAPAPYSLPTQREARQLHIASGNASDAKMLVTYGMTVPYEGIAQLTTGFFAAAPPPDPLRHVWATGASMTLDTGAGQGGAWLVHESATGDLQVQSVADGRVRGQEQVPVWLLWVRSRLMIFAAVLAVFGALLGVAGLVWPLRRQNRVRAKG